jgi:signal transduction histidine kinase
VIAAALLCAASVIPTSKRVGTPRLTHELLPGLGIVLGAVLVAFAVAAQLPAPEERDAVNPQIFAKVFGAPTVVTVAHLLNMFLYGTASYAFTRRAYFTRDHLLAWIGAGTAVSSGSWLVYAVFPPVFADHLYAADFLRTAFHVLLLVGATREISGYWDAVAKVAATEERRRLARDLHDGVVQELGIISRELGRLEAVPPRVRSELESATRRALDEARDAIDVWSRPPDEPVARALAGSVAEVARRYDVLVRTSFDDVSLDGRSREALVRIAREAVGNAARNGGASIVDVRLYRDEDGYVLTITDDGTGFDVVAADRAGVGYGLTSMRERAESLGGQLVIDSAPGDGTRVEMRWL